MGTPAATFGDEAELIHSMRNYSPSGAQPKHIFIAGLAYESEYLSLIKYELVIDLPL